MSKAKKILIIVGLVGVAVGGFALTKWLTRNTKRVRGGIIRVQEFETPAEPVEFEEE